VRFAGVGSMPCGRFRSVDVGRSGEAKGDLLRLCGDHSADVSISFVSWFLPLSPQIL
jgi:hypothetical protein